MFNGISSYVFLCAYCGLMKLLNHIGTIGHIGKLAVGCKDNYSNFWVLHRQNNLKKMITFGKT